MLHFLLRSNILTLSVQELIYAYANRLDPGQPPSNSAAGLRSNLFASWSTIPNENQEEFKGFKKQTTIHSIFRKLPSIQRVNFGPFYLAY